MIAKEPAVAWRLSRPAKEDIRRIAKEGARRFGRAQARLYHDGLERLFDRLADYPEMARERQELIPPARVQPYGAHVVFYAIGKAGIDILRVRHGRENWLEVDEQP